jgi:DNA-directed RNA polymerase subunit beta'
MIMDGLKARNAEEKVVDIEKKFKRGFLTNKERKENVIKVWAETTNKVTDALMEGLSPFNPVYMMSQSGARGNINQIKQLAGMRGNMTDTSGKTIEIPIKSNLREGMNVLEFFISSHGARKALSDTALKTADSGYLTRRLVDVAQDVIVREQDCGTEEFIEVGPVYVGSAKSRRIVESLEDRISGRYAAKDIIHP